MHVSRLTQDRVTVAENDQSSEQSTHQKRGEHAGDEDVHVDHLVGLTCYVIPHTYKSTKAGINPSGKDSTLSETLPFYHRNAHVCV